MKIVVIGGTGLIGFKLVALLRQRGQEVLAASPNSGVNTVTGDVETIRAPGATFIQPILSNGAVMSTLRTLGTALILSFGIQLAQSASAADPQPVVTPLMLKELADVPGREMAMLTVVYPPGAVDHVHRHDAYAFVYVLEGSIVEGVRGGKEVTLVAGQTFYEGPDDVHTVGRNASKTKPAKFVAILLKKKGVAAVLPAD